MRNKQILNHYQPIACDRHDIYEIAILRGQSLRLKWRQQGQTHQRTVRPRDLVIADGAEWLIADDPDHSGLESVLRLRLDWINHAEVLGN